MPTKSEQRVALVTGSAKRLGQALLLALAERGLNVVVHYRNSREEAEATAAAAEELGVRAILVAADLAVEEETQSLFARIREEYGRLDVLIHNASNLEFAPLLSLSWEQWQAGLEPLHAAFLCCREALKLMQHQAYGRIINITDSSAERIYAAENNTPYRIGKSGILLVTKSLAASVKGEKVTINAIAPGTLNDSQTRPETDKIPAGRYAGYQDVIQVMDFLLDERSSYISGASLKVSGGWDLA